MWQPIETAPIDERVLLFCPDRGNVTNKERVELDYARTSSGSHHAWATHWAPLPSGPAPDDVEAALRYEEEREHHARVAEEEYHREMEATHR